MTFLPSVSQGFVERITQLNPPRASDKIVNKSSTTQENPAKVSKSAGYDLENIILNPLENFAYYTPLWTLSALEKNQYNNPASYRNKIEELKYVVFSSGGRYDNQRVNTLYGASEFFINNFVMQTTVASNQKTGNSNAFKFTFDVFEPHTMGLFLQSLQNAAVKAKFKNYLNKCPFCLRLDICGYDEDGRIQSWIKPKFWTLQLTKVTFSVNETGSNYKVEAVPMSHAGFSDTINTAFTDIKLVASRKGPDVGTVKDLLSSGERSLCAYLNANEQVLLNEGRIGTKDEYIIEFPEKSDEFINNAQIKSVERRATADPKEADQLRVRGTAVPVVVEFGQNEIGKADFGFDQRAGGNYPFEQHGDIVNKDGTVDRDQMQINPKSRTFQFTQKQSLTAIINQIILSSTYAKKALDPKNLVDGFVKWWRLDVQIQLLDLDTKTGDYAQRIIYRVVPFLVHSSIFSPPNAVPPGYKALGKQIVKEYNYIYTGKNTDVLTFNIEINNLFYTGQTPRPVAANAQITNQDQKGIAPQPGKKVEVNSGNNVGAQLANTGRHRPLRDPEQLDATNSGTDKDTELAIAQSFHKAFINSGSGDLVKVDLEILGDPYWMVDSGISNYFARVSDKSRLLTEDGTMNYEGGDVFIYITFRTPADINETVGLYQWPSAGKESPFSGIYRVIQCENIFNDGTFRQKLKCVRQIGQSRDFVSDNPNEIADLTVDKLEALALEVGKEVVKTGVADDQIQPDQPTLPGVINTGGVVI